MAARCALGLALGWCGAAGATAQDGFVNWESPHVHPLDLIPDGTRLLAVNTADARLEVFDLTNEPMAPVFEVQVGLDPVSVRALSNERAWVVDRVSDSISVVDLKQGRVLATLRTDDEPSDVVFAGTPLRAFVSCSTTNALLVFDPARLETPPTRVAIDGEDPRALAVSPDGRRVYVAIFASGNDSTVLAGGSLFNIDFPPNIVNRRTTPSSGRNPRPNVPPDPTKASSAGAANANEFEPPLRAENPPPPTVALIVKRDAAGQWRDDVGGDWTNLVSGANAALSGRPVGWELADDDLAIVDTSTLGVTYARHLMNTCMALAVQPGTGDVTLVGTDATNERRFEPVLRGRFLRVEMARIDASGAPSRVTDLNAHLDHEHGSVPAAARARSVGDPRGVAWNADGTRVYVAGMGSNNVVAFGADGARTKDVEPIRVGEGPTGIVHDSRRDRLYVLCRFESAISIVDAKTNVETRRVRFFDPTPAAIRTGRKHLYDTQTNSGLGQIACASCHVDARLDHLGWDLGDPSGAVKPLADLNLAAKNPALLESEIPGRGPFEPFHPMKGPMTTQTLQDVIGHEPLHWRGDRSGIEEFAGAFVTLQGKDAPPSASEMQELEDYLATITYPPNPYRDFDNALPAKLPLPGHFTTGRFGPAGRPLPDGDARAGLERFRTGKLDNHKVECVTCHTLPSGYGTDMELVDGEYRPIATGADGRHHHMLVSQDGSTNVSMKVPQLRNLYDKVGFDLTQTRNRLGFGFLHDGTVDSLARFVNESAFSLESDVDTANMVAFLLSFSGSDLPNGSTSTVSEPPGPPSKDTHAAVGRRVTIAGTPSGANAELVSHMLALADAKRVGLVAKGFVADGAHDAVARGYVYVGDGVFQSDRASEHVTAAELAASSAVGRELTYTVVPLETAHRLGVDRDADGALDRDELDQGSDPADARSRPSVAPTAPGTPRSSGR